jgi:putative Holliday junction resolvase
MAPHRKPPSGTLERVAAIDLGKARVGLALSDELGLMAHPRPPLDGRKRRALLERLGEFAAEEGIGRFLVGLPLSMSGREGVAAQRAMRFCQQLADATGVAVELVDERLTTVQAERELSASGVRGDERKQRVDGVAAALMLQHWLDARRADSDDDEPEDHGGTEDLGED